MADIIGQETWTADGKSYVIKVTEPGATVTENAISIISDITTRQGAPNSDPLRPILPTELSFVIRDNSKLFRSAMDGKEVGDVVLEFTEDGSTIFKGYVLQTFERALSWESNPEYKVTAYDSIKGLQGFDWDITGEKTPRSMLYQICTKIGLSLRINMLFDWEHDGVTGSKDPVDALQTRAEQLLSEGATYYDVLVFLCTFFNAQFFQAGGEWYFMQRHLRTAANVTNYPTSSSGSLLTDETVNYKFSLTDSDLHRDTTFFSYRPATTRIVSEHTYPSYLLKNPGWLEGNKYWDSLGGVAGSTSSRRRFEGDGDYLTQTIGVSFIRVPDDFLNPVSFTYDHLVINSHVYVSIGGSATGTHTLDYLKVEAKAPDGTAYYLTTGGSWSTTEQFVGRSIDFGGNTSSTFDFPISITTPVVPLELMQITLTLYSDKSATGNAGDINWIEFEELRIGHMKPEAEDDKFRAEGFTVTETSTNPGQNVEEEFQVGDTDDSSFYGPGVWEYDNGSDWLPTQSWSPDSNRVHQKRAANIKAQTEARQESYEFSHKFGDSPEMHNVFVYDEAGGATGKVYVPVYIKKTYKRNAKVKTVSAAVELLGATASV